MNKKISFPIAIIIIVVCAVLVGGVVAWQYGLFPEISWESISFPPKPTKEVTITTDKTEYEQDNTVKIILENNLDKSVCLDSLAPYDIEKKKENWYTYCYAYQEEPIIEKFVKEGYLKEECIKSKENRLFEYKGNPYSLGTGTYRISVRLCIDCEGIEYREYRVDKKVFSNEFTVKESAAELELSELEKEQMFVSARGYAGDKVDLEFVKKVDRWALFTVIPENPMEDRVGIILEKVNDKWEPKGIGGLVFPPEK